MLQHQNAGSKNYPKSCPIKAMGNAPLRAAHQSYACFKGKKEMLNQNQSTFSDFDGSRRFVITENNKAMSTNLFSALFCTMLMLISIWYWYQFLTGHLFPFEETVFRLPAFLGIFCVPLSVLFGLAFISPRKLIFDQNVIEYRKLGFSTKINWTDVIEIVGKNNIAWIGQPGPQIRTEMTITIVARTRNISLSPIFETSQLDLLSLLRNIWSDQKMFRGMMYESNLQKSKKESLT